MVESRKVGYQNVEEKANDTNDGMQNIRLPLDFRKVDYWDNIEQANDNNDRMQNSSLPKDFSSDYSSEYLLECKREG